MTISVTADYTVAAGQTLNFAYPADPSIYYGVYELDGGASLTILGSVSFDYASYPYSAAPVRTSYYGGTNASFHIGAGASVTLSGSGGADLFLAYSPYGAKASFSNEGTISISASGWAEVTELRDGGSFSNSGVITVTEGDGPSHGVYGSDQAGAVTTVVNTGAITAGKTIESGYGSLALTNSGTLNGDVDLSLSQTGSQVRNTGTINGAVRFAGIGDGGGADLYDGRGGTLTDGVHLGSGLDIVYLGDDGETVVGGSGTAIVTGGAGADVIGGGTADDLIDGGGGADSLTGGLGADVFMVTATSGAATITDFSDAQGDRVDLTNLGIFTSLADVQARAHQSGANTVITVGSGALTLQNVQLSGLKASDFIYSGQSYHGTPVNNAAAVAGLHVFSGANFVAGAYALTSAGVLTNNGYILVEGHDMAETIVGIVGGVLHNNADLIVRESASGSIAHGVSTDVSVDNAGLISVSAGWQAIGAVLNYSATLHNSGSITAAAANASYGVLYQGVPAGTSAAQIINSGVITAQHAISSVLGSDGPSLTLVNSGTINGDVDTEYGQSSRGGYDVQINNTGTINGDIHLGAAAKDYFDGRGGTLNGSLYLSGGSNTIYLGNDGETVQAGYGGRATILGGSGADSITAGNGSDTIDGGGGNDTLDGGGGVNTASFASAPSGVTVSLAFLGQAQNTVGAGTDTLSNFQNLTGSAFNDTLEGDGGNNVLDGGAGINTVSYAHAAAGVTASLAVATAQNTGGAGADTLTNFQNLAGSAFDDTLEGDGGNNVLDGGGGTNTLSYAHAASGVTVSLAVAPPQNTGGAGADTFTNFQNLTGSGFNDALEGDGGNNVLDGGGGTNTVSYAHAAGGVTASLAIAAAQDTGGAGSDTLRNFQNLTGSAFNDTLEGDGGNNVLNGAAGTNTVSYAHAASGVTVSLALQGQAQNTGGAGTDTLSNFQNVTGSAFNDVLTGDAHDNVLTGGSGADTFVMRDGGADTIADFSHAQGDKIDLSAYSQLHTLADVTAAASQVGADTVITLGSGSLTLKNVTKGALAAGDFLLASAAPGPFHINITYDASVSNAPAAFKTAVQAAVDYFERTFTNNETVNITFGWGSLGGRPLDAGALGENSTFYSAGYSYQAVVNALATANASSPAAALAVSGLPSTSPVSTTFAMTTAAARALGLTSSAPSVDGYVGLSSAVAFTFDPNNRAVAGKYDAIGTLEHEISEVLGRTILTGDALSSGRRYYAPLDLFRYVSPNVHTYLPGYANFSLNGDQTLEVFNNDGNGGDGGDWATGAQPDPYDAFGSPGQAGIISAADVRVMQVLGYHVSPTAPTPHGTPGSPVTVSQTASLLSGQTLSFTGPAAIVFSPTSATVAPAYSNAGTILDSGADSQIDVIGVGYDSNATAVLNQGLTSTFTNSATGVLTVNAVAAGSDAVGVYFGPTLVHNAGAIQVTSAAADAFGDLGVSYTGDAGATLTVQAPNEAVGLYLSGRASGAVVSNAGAIQVSGLYAYGVICPYTLTNSGSITATGVGAGAESVGVYLGASGQTYASVTNSGVITAQTAVAVSSSLTGLVATILNTGTINGDVDLGAGTDTLTSTGGTINGVVRVGAGYSAVSLGAEDNTVALGAGIHAVDAGGGVNTASYASATAAVTVSLALQAQPQFTGVGTDTLTHFQNLTGSAFADRLTGDAGANLLSGGAGADLFVFKVGAGHDTVADFSHDEGDRLDLTNLHLHGLSDALAHAAQAGSNTVLTVGSDQIVLRNVTKNALSAQDLILSTAAHDVTGTGYSAVVFRNPSGDWGYAAFDSSGSYTWTPMGGSGASYGLVGNADFDGDGISDMLFREGSTGNWGFAQMNGAGGYAWNFMGGSTQSYGEVAVGDFNGDGSGDIIFREQATGNWGIAQMHGASYAWLPMGGSTASYSLAGAGDFNGDGVADVLFRDNRSGDWGVAFMNTSRGYAWAPEGGSTASYSVAGTGDFNGDGTSDVLFRENATGNWGYAAMNQAGGWTWAPMGGSTPSYGVASTGDYNGDGTADIAFREAGTGNWGYAAMHGASYDWVFLGGSTASYGAF